jgi:hypothetical protein
MAVRRKWLVGLALGAVAAAVLFFRDPHIPGRYGYCPFHVLTGLYCPGCGSTRALNDLLHLRPARALHENALLVFTLPFLLIALGRAFYRDWLDPSLPRLQLRPYIGWVYLALVAAFLLARNLPWTPFTMLAP